MKKHTAFVMIGAMGSGKSTIARLLAEELQLEYIDPDVYWERDEAYTWERACENFSHSISEQYMCVKLGKSYVYDTSSRVRRVRQEAVRVVQAWSHGKPEDDFRVVGVYVTADVETCLLHNSQREFPQPENMVRQYHRVLKEDPPNQRIDGFDALITITNDVELEPAHIKAIFRKLRDKGKI
jgi:predicted kinase